MYCGVFEKPPQLPSMAGPGVKILLKGYGSLRRCIWYVKTNIGQTDQNIITIIHIHPARPRKLNRNRGGWYGGKHAWKTVTTTYVTQVKGLVQHD